MDDAYITFVYARNLAEGYGLRFNADDPKPTEGFSSLSHVLITAVALRAGAEPLSFTRGLGFIAFLAVPVVLALAMRRCLGGPLGPTLCVTTICWGGFAFLPETSMQLAGGMETVFFTVLLGWFGAWTLVGLAQPRWSAGLIAAGTILCLFLSLTRPEGVLVAVGTLVALLAARRLIAGDSDLRGVLATLGLLAVCYGGYVGWKLVYFGSALPNPYYVKAHNAVFGSAGRWLPGLSFVAGFLQARLLPIVVSTIALACAMSLKREAILAGLAMVATPAAIVLAYSRAIHETATSLRYEYPFLLPFAVCGMLCLRILWDRTERTGGWVLLILAYAIYLLGSVRPSMVLRWVQAPVTSASAWANSRPDNPWSRMGHDLSKTGLGRHATILLSAAGQIPYFSRFFTIDWIGLNTERLSGRYRLSLGEVWAYIESYKPDVVYSFLPPARVAAQSPEQDPGFSSTAVQGMLTGGLGGELFRQWDPNVVRAMFFQEMRYVRDGYVFGAAYYAGSTWRIFAYVRRDSPFCETILKTLRASPDADPSDLTALYGTDPRRLVDGCS